LKYDIRFIDDNSITFSFIEKFPNIDLDQEVYISPYDFEDKKTGKQKKGITVKQPADKDLGTAVQSYFRSYDEKEGWSCKYGFPSPAKGTFDPGKEKLRDRYNSDVSIFINEYYENEIKPLFAERNKEKEGFEKRSSSPKTIISDQQEVPDEDLGLPF
jgi:hypothetical protein